MRSVSRKAWAFCVLLPPPPPCPSALMCRLPPLFSHLLVQLKELKQELSGLRVAKVTGGAPNKLSKM